VNYINAKAVPIHAMEALSFWFGMGLTFPRHKKTDVLQNSAKRDLLPKGTDID
jgi:hypothetical protein